jgi:hypothetical protein
MFDDSIRSVLTKKQYDISGISRANEHSYSVRTSSPVSQSAATPSIRNSTLDSNTSWREKLINYIEQSEDEPIDFDQNESYEVEDESHTMDISCSSDDPGLHMQELQHTTSTKPCAKCVNCL